MKRIHIQLTIFLVVLLFTTILSTMALAATLEVCESGCDYTQIQDAIDAAQNGDTVLVYPGTYYEALQFSGRNSTTAKEITVKSTDPENPQIVESTVINATGKDQSAVTFNKGETEFSILSGFTITGASTFAYETGGGITVINKEGTEYIPSNPVISNCVITGNDAHTGGGAFFIMSSPRLINSKVTFNNSYLTGAGIAVSGGSPVIEDCEISSNGQPAYGDVPSDGGGVYLSWTTDVLITRCQILNNNSSSWGGGIRCLYGGAVISRSLIQGNSSIYGGGIAIAREPAATVENCVVRWNTSTLVGCGIFIGYLAPCPAKIINCTIAENNGQAFGIFFEQYSGSPMLTNSIVWGNEAAQIGIREGHGEPTPIVTYSDIQGGDPDNPGQPWPGEGNIDADPVFVEDDCGISGFALGQNSPCIDAAITAGAPAVDICGISRPQDMGGPSETLTDMGAYEYPASTVDILKAVYDYVNDALEVHASSPNGQDAALELIGYGPMEWDKKKSLWKKTVSEAIVPLSITVCGPLDGCATVY